MSRKTFSWLVLGFARGLVFVAFLLLLYFLFLVSTSFGLWSARPG